MDIVEPEQVIDKRKGLPMQPQDEALVDVTELNAEKGEFWPISSEMYHSFVLKKSQVAPKNILVLPIKMTSMLPSLMIPAVLSYGGKKWVMAYHGNRSAKTLDPRIWKNFVADNRLKIGDACVFELTESSCNILKFRVQILRGDIPIQLREKISGECKDAPILID